MSLTTSSTPDASTAPAEESRLSESQAELEIQENPRLAREEGLAPSQPGDADRPSDDVATDASGGAAGSDAISSAASAGRPSDPPGTSSADEPELHNEEDLPSDGRDHEGERMIQELGNEPHLRQPKAGQ